MKPGSVVHLDWHNSAESTEILESIVHLDHFKRKQFGLLEKPNLPPGFQEVPYKLFVTGKAGIGKTSTIAGLTGNTVPPTYSETIGVDVTVSYWPIKLVASSEVVLCRLEFWDAGDSSTKRFDYLTPACQDHVDGVLFLFSFTDKSSFDEIPELMSRTLQPLEKPQPIIVGTRYDMYLRTEVSARDVWEFEQRWKLPVIKMKNVPSREFVVEEREGISKLKLDFQEIAFALNIIAEQLWIHDQTSVGIHLHDVRS